MRPRLVGFVGGLPAASVDVWVQPLDVPAVGPRLDVDVAGGALPWYESRGVVGFA